MILKPLQRIQVVESSKKCKAGSLGYFVAQDRVGDYNAWDMCIVFTRFGKKGKPRIEPLKISSFMIDISTMKQSDKEILDTNSIREGLSPRVFTDRRGKIHGGVGNTIITPIPQISKNLLELPDNEFTAYIIAMSIFIHKLTSRRQARSLSNHPPFVNMRNFSTNGYNLGLVEDQAVGYYILHGIARDIALKKSELVTDDSATFAERYTQQTSTLARKKLMLDRFQIALAMAKDELNRYNKITEDCFNGTAIRINNILKYYRKDKKKSKAAESKPQNTSSNHGSYYSNDYTTFSIELDSMPTKRQKEDMTHWKQIIKVRGSS